MNKKILLVILIGLIVFVACAPTSNQIETSQQESAVSSIVQNQPVPDLGGYSFERQIMIETFLARNNTIATWAYMFTMDGKIVEICPSIGYPIPYATQLTAPEKPTPGYSLTIPQAEPNGLYTPADAAATLVQCVNPDGSVSPTYIEWYVLAFPYRIVSDVQLQRVGEPSFKVNINK